ncbi:hypothetical protein [Alienimonas chondri]|uniref:Uncharacterized protein n=1 Tax=Alienimonas chondri TaxID=2681879 RepID=A0ABX1VFT2_9PLAN|nr:hypothetical protein [Alienimonas chondri]NNJ26952.1 hypothetical protein [Alienimonas chondri]
MALRPSGKRPGRRDERRPEEDPEQERPPPLKQRSGELIAMAFPGLLVATHEPEEVVRDLAAACCEKS